jgi:hypothetical protein
LTSSGAPSKEGFKISIGTVKAVCGKKKIVEITTKINLSCFITSYPKNQTTRIEHFFYRPFVSSTRVGIQSISFPATKMPKKFISINVNKRILSLTI